MQLMDLFINYFVNKGAQGGFVTNKMSQGTPQPRMKISLKIPTNYRAH